MQLSRTIALVEQGIRQGQHIGAQLYVSLKGQVIADTAIGLARPARDGQPAVEMTPETITLWLSSGKPLTAVAIAQLWEKSLLDLDDPVAKSLPEFAAHGKDNITLRHILTHTAPLRLVQLGWPKAPWEQIIQRIADMPPEPRWTPGKEAGYSMTITWFILGEIVRRLSGQTIDAYVRDHVLSPCGMNNSFLAMSHQEYHALQYRLANMQVTETGQPTDYRLDTIEAATNPRPGASARGPIRELARFYETLSAPDPKILKRQTVEAITARHRVNSFDKTFNAVIDWGLGFIINSNIYGHPDVPYQYGPHASPRTFGHSGNQSSVAFADPDNALVAAIVFNGLPGETPHQKRIAQLLTTLYEELELANSK